MKKIILTSLLTLVIAEVYPQLKGDHILGDAGLNSGSQAAASVSFGVPIYYYNARSLRNDNGDNINPDPQLNMFLTGVAVSWVSNLKILGANYGNSVLFSFAKTRIEGNAISSETPLAFSDIYVQPLQLGWHTKKADYLFTYSMYLPTGKWALGGDENSGLGMLGNELAAGTTLYFDPKKTLHFSSLLSYEMNSKKKHTDIKTGNLLSLEGGLGKTLYGRESGASTPLSVINLGLIYYLQFKTTNDQIPIGSSVFTGSKDRIYALGAEGNLLLTGTRLLFGARWLKEFGAKNRFQGQTFFLTAGYAISTEKKARK